jgi:arylsulfatase A-like enzyme
MEDESMLIPRNVSATIAAAACLALLVACQGPPAADDARPNIILCMADDHGFHEVSYYDYHPHIKTPALDEMASQGLRFDRFYAGAPMCTPTRGTVMTGRHPNRYGAFFPNHSLRPEEITIAQILQQAGYATGHFGKWHLGPVKASSPTSPGAMGFDHWLSHGNFFSYNPPLSRDGAPPERIPGESSEVVVAETIKFIGDAVKQGKPFLSVVWFGSPHEPYSAIDEDMIPFHNKLPADVDKRLRHRLGEIVAMDRAIGQLRDYLESAGLRDNTLFWYNSDNGAPREGAYWSPLRAHKGAVYEGGIRVPAIIEWPALIPEPRVTNVLAVTSDILPTICDLLDLPLPERPLDGISLVPLLEGKMTERPESIFFWYYDRQREKAEGSGPWLDAESQHGTTPTSKRYYIDFENYRHPVARTDDFRGRAAVMENRYKLVVPGDGSPSELYDIVADMGESKNLAAEHPDKVKAMEAALLGWQRNVEVSLTGADYENGQQ